MKEAQTGKLALARAADWGGVELAAYPYTGGFNYYPVEWRRLNSRTKLLRWIRHLTCKRWFSSEMCRDFIEVVAGHFGWDMDAPL